MAELKLTQIARVVFIAELLLTGVGGTVTSTPMELRLSNVSGTVTSNPLRLRLTEVNGSVTSVTAPVANAGPDQTVEPLSTVTLPVTATNSPTSYLLTQTSGPTVVLSGPENNRSFQAPTDVAGVTLIFSATATNSAGTSSPDSVTVFVYPHLHWILTAGAWLPANESSMF